MPATLAHARHWCRVLPSSACAAGIGQPCSSASFAFAAFEQPSHASRRTEPVVTRRCLPAQSVIKGGSIPLPSTQQPTQTAVVLSMCLHVSCAAAWLCADRERRRSRHANSCGGHARVLCRRSSAGIARSSSCAVRRRRARERGHVVKEASRHGIQLSSADDSLPQSTAPIIVPRRLTVYRSLSQSIW